MSKINILVLPSDTTGVGKFRSVDPHTKLQELYGDDFNVDIDYNPQVNDPDYWKKYQIVHFHRSITRNPDQSARVIKTLNQLGIITICDLDDYWLPTKEHPAHAIVMKNGIHKGIQESLKLAQFVTTTTDIFRKEIEKFNKNVFVLPNCIDPNEDQFNEKTTESDVLRFGWLGGSSHLHDIQLLSGISTLDSVKDKFGFVLCGFDTRGSVTEIGPDGTEKVRDIKPLETVWYDYEKIVTNNFKHVKEDHKEFLHKFVNEEYSGDDQSYKRVWTLPVTSYAKNYSKFDVSLAPIKDHIFNKMKSQLKVIEAGFYKKPIIASNYGPYTIDLKHSLDKGNFVDGNALLVDPKRPRDWAKFMKKLIDNPSWVEDLGERLYETVKDKYDLNNMTKVRAEIYKSLVK
jgi:glycosyltransferase involved in cell wall biosynthesis